jgi:predicted GNAT superfamily acetyltransferase
MDEKESIRKESLTTTRSRPVAEDDHLAVHLPASLAGLSEEEREAAAKRATRKVDIMLIPALTLLYLLNFL